MADISAHKELEFQSKLISITSETKRLLQMSSFVLQTEVSVCKKVLGAVGKDRYSHIGGLW